MDIRDIEYIVDAHQNYPRKPSKAFRKWDEKTPYYTHPLWCATTIATETNLEERTRANGIQVLLYHDLLEDTTRNLPSWLSPKVKYLIKEMTFEGGSKQEMNEIWNKSDEIKLYKLYDKANNLMDGAWMNKEKREIYENYTRKLSEVVKQKYGNLNITRIADSILKRKNEK